MINENEFKELIEKGWSLRKIGRHFGFSLQTAANWFKKIYGMSCSELKTKRRAEMQKKQNIEYTDQYVSKALDILRTNRAKYILSLEKLFEICDKNSLEIRVLLLNDNLRDVYVSNKYVIFKEYLLEGIRKDESRGCLRFRPPSGRKYDFLIVTLSSSKKNNFYILPKNTLLDKKTINLPLREVNRSKYSRYLNNWQQFKTGEAS